MPEHVFFSAYGQVDVADGKYYKRWEDALFNVRESIPELPFGNIWIARQLHDKIPIGSSLHLGILNSLRSWNMMETPSGVESACNVGGFGIDGCVSTMIGASIANPHKLFFGVFGDLAFFYDLNAIGNRHIGNNVRILLINNGCGAEFSLSSHPAAKFGEQVFDYIAAGRHFKNGAKPLVKHYAEDLGFRYLSATNKQEFGQSATEFLSQNSEQAIIFECFTKPQDESDALSAMYNIVPSAESSITRLRSVARQVVPVRVKNAIKELVK